MLLVEGMAVTLEEDEGRLTLMQQAALMKRLGRLPPVEALMRPWGFWLESGARAYTAAGAFLRFVGEQRGGPALAAIYRDGVLPGDTSALESAWHAHLDSVEVPEPGVSSQFTRIFKRASVVERRCVDEVAEMWTTAHAAAAARDWDRAERAFGRILSLDESDDEPLLQLMEALSHEEDNARWRGVMSQLDARGPDAVATARMAQAAAEAAIRAQRWDEAAVHLDRAFPLVKGSSQERSVRLLRFSVDDATGPPCQATARAVLEFLAGDGPQRARGRSDLLALERGYNAAAPVEKQCAGILSAVRYLQGRQLVAEDPARAEEALGQAVQWGLPVDLLGRETARLRGEAAEHAGRFVDAANHYAQARLLGVTPGERAEAAMLERRARFAAEKIATIRP
jgi:tetratricopeptide (TPR) repeat protein